MWNHKSLWVFSYRKIGYNRRYFGLKKKTQTQLPSDWPKNPIGFSTNRKAAHLSNSRGTPTLFHFATKSLNSYRISILCNLLQTNYIEIKQPKGRMLPVKVRVKKKRRVGYEKSNNPRKEWIRRAALSTLRHRGSFNRRFTPAPVTSRRCSRALKAGGSVGPKPSSALLLEIKKLRIQSRSDVPAGSLAFTPIIRVLYLRIR